MALPPRPPGLPERYTVVRHIADGGMASVWEATDELLGRNVAVKVLSPALAADPAARRRFTREARAAARLSTHPHVVTVYDAGEHDGTAYLVMALYKGGTVAGRIKAGPVPRSQALGWLEDAAGALDLAHGEGVVHRDVKPANLLLDARDRVAVGDFGIATAAWETSMTQTGLVLGTVAYLAPEQRTGGVATPASDRYALGLVARELLTGARPGAAASHPAALPASADGVLRRATAEDPAARHPTCADFVDELEAALRESTTAAIPAAAPRSRVVAAQAPVDADPPTALLRAPVAARAPVARAPASGPARPGPARPGVDAASKRGSALLGLGLVALLLAVGIFVVATAGGDDPEKPRRTAATTPTPDSASKAKSKTKSTTQRASPPKRTTTSKNGSAPKSPATAEGGSGSNSPSTANDGSGSSSPSTSESPAAADTPSASPSAPPAPTTTPETAAAPEPAAAPQPEAQPDPAPAAPANPNAAGGPASAGAPASPSAKSRGRLIAQNDQAFLRTRGDPAGQVAPLQEAVTGLCTDPSDINCAFALFNLAQALRLAGRPGEAIPLLERRLQISDFKEGTVRQELSQARAAAGGG